MTHIILDFRLPSARFRFGRFAGDNEDSWEFVSFFVHDAQLGEEIGL